MKTSCWKKRSEPILKVDKKCCAMLYNYVISEPFDFECSKIIGCRWNPPYKPQGGPILSDTLYLTAIWNKKNTIKKST